MTERLRYTGTQAVSFLTGDVGEVKPGDEFDVPDGLAEGFLRRADIERVTAPPTPPLTAAPPPSPAATPPRTAPTPPQAAV